MSLNVSDLISQFGAYYLNNGQNAADLHRTLKRPSVTASFFRTIPINDTIFRQGSAEMTRVLQAFQKAFTPIGDVTFKGVEYTLRRLKIDWKDTPDDLAYSWVGYLTANNLDRSEWPAIRYLLSVLMPERKNEDYELNEVYTGVYAAPTVGVAAAAGTAMNGIARVFTDLGARKNTIVMGVAPTGAVAYVDYVESFVAAMGKEYRKRIDYVFMSEDAELLYQEGKRQKYNLQYAQVNDLKTIYHFPNAKVQGLPSMGSAAKLWATLPQNRIRPVKFESNINQVLVQQFSPREVSVYTDWYECIGFLHPESVYVSDQA